MSPEATASRGLFISFEGIDGAGKSTHIEGLAKAFRDQGSTVTLTREPGGTPLAERVRELVLNRGGEAITPVTETLLMFAARGIHVNNRIRPALARGEWVVCDRFTDATRAYQGAGRGVDRELIEHLARAVHGDLQPDRTLLLDLPVELGQARARQRSGPAPTDRFEEEADVFFERVRREYLRLARAEPQRFRILDASAPLQQIERQIPAALQDLI
jgi:dTMP kinase